MAGKAGSELIDVYLVEPGQGRPPWGPLEHLPPDAPMPQVGDLLLLPGSVTGDSKEQTYAWGGTLAPFRVIQREHVYFREPKEKFKPVNPKPARYVRTMVYVRRLTEDEFHTGLERAAN